MQCGDTLFDDVRLIHSLFPGKAIHVTEFNRLVPADFFTCLQTLGVESGSFFLLGGTADQAQYDLLKQPAFYHSFKYWRPPVSEYTSPNHDGPRARTLGVVIHATLGGSATPEGEYQATIGWFNSPASQVSAHAVAGPGGKVAYPVDPNLIAWHCRASNATHLGIEMAKARVGDVVEPAILDAAAKVVAGWCQRYAIPLVWSTTNGLAEHHEMPTNTDGHQDVGGPFDRADFLARVKQYAEGALTDQQKAAVLDDLNVLWGMAKADTIKVNPAEAERTIHERIVALKVTLGLNG